MLFQLWVIIELLQGVVELGLLLGELVEDVRLRLVANPLSINELVFGDTSRSFVCESF